MAGFLRKDISLVVFGGTTSDSSFLSDTWTYSLMTQQWKKISNSASAPSPRKFSAKLVSVNPSTLILFGGISSTGEILGDFWSFSLSGGEWKPVTFAPNLPLPRARFGHTFVTEKTNSALMFGGTAGVGSSASGSLLAFFIQKKNSFFTVFMNDLWRLQFNGVSYSIAQVIPDGSDIPSPRYGHASAFVSGEFSFDLAQ